LFSSGDVRLHFTPDACVEIEILDDAERQLDVLEIFLDQIDSMQSGFAMSFYGVEAVWKPDKQLLSYRHVEKNRGAGSQS
jgi:hypothetical protein